MDWYEAEVSALVSFHVEQPPIDGRVIFYGSSSIRLWSSLVEDFPDLAVVNLGFGGSTLAACAHFFERVVVPCKPQAIVFYAGDNDLGDGLSPEQVLRSLQQLRQKVQRYRAELPFAFISIKPSPARWPIRERIRRANQLAQEELATWPTAHYIDIFPQMLGTDGTPRPELFADDGLHLSAEGYRVWARVVNDARAQFT
jgi:lysophospholipase L1-like esterase